MDEAFVQEVYESKRGIDCPCCGRYAKVYSRPLTSAVARVLIWMYKVSGEGTPWLHFNEAKGVNPYPFGGGDHAKLRFWGMIEPKPMEVTDGDKRTAGIWRITEKGKQFAKGEIEVPAKVRLLFNEFLGYEGEMITIQDALGKKFSYSELMSDDG